LGEKSFRKGIDGLRTFFISLTTKGKERYNSISGEIKSTQNDHINECALKAFRQNSHCTKEMLRKEGAVSH